MRELVKEFFLKNGVTIRFESLPENVLGLYTNILGEHYIIVNKNLPERQEQFISLSCYYQYIVTKETRLFMVDDVNNANDPAFEFARKHIGKLVA